MEITFLILDNENSRMDIKLKHLFCMLSYKNLLNNVWLLNK